MHLMNRARVVKGRANRLGLERIEDSSTLSTALASTVRGDGTNRPLLDRFAGVFAEALEAKRPAFARVFTEQLSSTSRGGAANPSNNHGSRPNPGYGKENSDEIPMYPRRHVTGRLWQSTRRTATSMPAPAAGAANGLAVLSRASRPQPRPPMHWRRPCALIWSIWSPVS